MITFRLTKNGLFYFVVHHDEVEDRDEVEIEADVDQGNEQMVEVGFAEKFDDEDRENQVGHELSDAGETSDL
jgi:hypothetical protein